MSLSSSSRSVVMPILRRQVSRAQMSGLRRTPTTTTATTKSNPAITKRFMSGGDHHYDLPVPQSMEAKLFGDHQQEPEGWESSIYFMYTVAVVMIVAAVWWAPDTTIKTWAQTEARTRLALLESGKIDKVEFGRHYYQEILESGKRLEDWENNMSKGISTADDDDDDDDEEEEEEEEEEE